MIFALYAHCILTKGHKIFVHSSAFFSYGRSVKNVRKLRLIFYDKLCHFV